VKLEAFIKNRGRVFILDIKRKSHAKLVVDWVDLLAGLYDGLGAGPSKEMADGLAFIHN